MAPSKKKAVDPADAAAVPKAVVSRLSLYLRELHQLAADDRETISSGELGQRLGFTDAQVRKDLAYFGQFGYPGIGYRTAELVEAIRRILGTEQQWPVAMVGIGNLGRALLGYKGFGQQGFHIAAAFDADESLVGTSIDEVRIHAMADLPQVVPRQGIRLGMIAVPAGAAQAVADQLVAAGVEGVVNFAPVTISLPEQIHLVGVDLAIELEQISFAVVNRSDSR